MDGFGRAIGWESSVEGSTESGTDEGTSDGYWSTDGRTEMESDGVKGLADGRRMLAE